MAKDPYRYFRIEARELLDGLSQGVLALEKSGTSPDLLARLLRLAHTLKGAARVVKQGEVAELAHEMEELLTPLRGAGAGARAPVNQLLALVDTCGERLKPVFAAPARAGEPAPPPKPEEPGASLRVEVTEVDALLYELADASVRLGELRQQTTTLDRIGDALDTLAEALAAPADELPNAGALRALATDARAALREHTRSLSGGVERTRQDLDRVRDRVSDLRLLPAQEVFAPLGRTARDAAEALQKRVTFDAAGGEHRLDAHILLAVRDALIQVVRNCVAHGIETDREREAAGKPREGLVRLRVFKRGGRVHFVVEDDGRGVDLAAIKRVVVARRLAAPAAAEALTTREAIQLLFQGGFSTASAVSEVSGRGVGLDVVRSVVARLKGDIDLRSEPGRGTTVELAVPVSLESLDALAVVANGWTGLIPFDAVRRTVRLAASDLVHSAAVTTLFWEGEAVPFRTLAEVVGGRAAAAKEWTAVVVGARGGAVAVGVDRLDGVRNVVVRPLPPLTGPVPLIGSATLDAAGDPQLVLDPAALVDAVRAQTGRAPEPVAARPLPILVVDDSLTTRMLEQSILETAGYEVDLATSGEEGLEKARRNRYAVFVVDVEMPGMNGFELLERFRTDPVLHQTPAILVTSRVSPDDLRRGELVGARAHIPKSAFDAGHLLSTIRRLIGGTGL